MNSFAAVASSSHQAVVMYETCGSIWTEAPSVPTRKIPSDFAEDATANWAAARSPAPVANMAKASQRLRLIAQAQTDETREKLERLVVGAERLADALGERLGGQRRLVAVA